MSDAMSREYCSDCGGDFGNCRFSKDDEGIRVICHGCEDALNSPLVQSLRQQLATITQERDAHKAADEYLTKRLEVQEAEMDKMEKERDALREAVREFLAEDIDGRESCRLNRDGTPRKDCKCISCRALSLLTPSGEAGKGGGDDSYQDHLSQREP